MKQIMIATSNQNKIREFKEMLEPLGYQVQSLLDLSEEIEIIENGETFQENALIKAKSVYDVLRMPVISDDSGISCDCLDGGPGVYSARFMGKDTPYCEKNAYLIEKARKSGKYGCRYVCVIAYLDEAGNAKTFEGIVEGLIHDRQIGENGFGYDPIFYYPPSQATWAQIAPEDKNAVSHRGIALRQFLAYLKGE